MPYLLSHLVVPLIPYCKIQRDFLYLRRENHFIRCFCHKYFPVRCEMCRDFLFLQKKFSLATGVR